MRFAKYHALGNDYLLLVPAGHEQRLGPPVLRQICDRHICLVSDGILFGPASFVAEVVLSGNLVRVGR